MAFDSTRNVINHKTDKSQSANQFRSPIEQGFPFDDEDTEPITTSASGAATQI